MNEMSRMSRLGLDITVPNAARIYDYFLGGKDNFEADRAAAEKIAKLIPGSAEACCLNRDFLGRVVKYLAVEAGIRQFLDIGSGLPTTQNVHEIAKDVDPEARIVYVDYDPMVIIHARVILEQKSKGVAVVEGDLKDPQRIIDNPRVRELIDFSQPVAVLMFAVLHFIRDDEWPGDIVRHFKDVMAPGSYRAVAHHGRGRLRGRQPGSAGDLPERVSPGGATFLGGDHPVLRRAGDPLPRPGEHQLLAGTFSRRRRFDAHASLRRRGEEEGEQRGR